MNVDLKGFKRNCGKKLMGDFIVHRNRALSEAQTRKLVNYAIEQGYETIADVPDEIADKICDNTNTDFDQYDDTPDFYTLDDIKSALWRIKCYRDEWEPDDIIDRLKEAL